MQNQVGGCAFMFGLQRIESGVYKPAMP